MSWGGFPRFAMFGALLVSMSAPSSLALSREQASGPAPTRLILIGGGERPPAALARFIQWGGGSRSKLLVITWASEVPDATFESLKNDLKPHGYGEIEAALSIPTTESEKLLFLKQLERSTAIFFSGGDQKRLMRALDDVSDPRIREAILAKFAAGTPVAGTSAGTAIMSDVMIAGDTRTARGFGLLPVDIVVDQHFTQRDRLERLVAALRAHSKTGIGVDEGSALLITNGRQAEVVGSRVTWVDLAKGTSQPQVTVLGEGARFDLKERLSPASRAGRACHTLQWVLQELTQAPEIISK